MKLKNIFVFSLLASLFATGCVKETATGSFSNITVDKTFLYIGKEGGSVDLTVNAGEAWYFVKNENWTKVVSFNKDEKGSTIKAKHDYYGNLINEESDINASKTTDSWLSASVMEGQAGETKVTFTAAASEGGREITLAIVCGTSKQHFIVRQGSLEAVAATCEEIIAGPDAKTYRAKGTVTAIASTTYGNWYLKDDTGEIYIYGTLDANGAEKNFESLNIEVGDLVEVEGPKTTYGSVVELVNVTVLSISKSLLKICTNVESYVKEEGDHVAKVAYKGRGLDYSIPKEFKDWITVTGISSYAGTPSKLEQNPADTALVSFHLAANPAGDRTGKIVFASAEGKDSTTVDFNILQKGAILEVTAAEINAAEDGLTQYRYTGYVSKVEDAAKGKIYVTDYTGTVYLYKVTDYAASGVEEGDIITVVGKKSSYNEAPQLIESVVEKRIDVKDIDLASFKALEDNKESFYRISGTVTESTEPNTKFDLQTYGNFALTDGTTEVYVYGVVPGYGGPSKQFATLGVEKGDKLTIVCYKTSFTKNNYVLNQAGGAFYVSHEKGSSEGGEEGGNPGEGENPGAGENPGEGGDTPAYTMISSVADLTAGTYYMGGYAKSYDNNDFSDYPYHLCTGVSSDLFKTQYAFSDGKLIVKPESSYSAYDVILEAVPGKDNTYNIKIDGAYLVTTAAENRKLAKKDSIDGIDGSEWVASDFSKGGIIFTTTFKGTSISFGTAGASSKIIRSYKSSDTLVNGVYFFKKN